MVNQKCGICGKRVEVYPCNDDKGIFTYVKDTDATGTKKESIVLCSYHALRVSSFIFSLQYEEGKKVS